MSQPLFGILNVDKPPGLTSRRVVDRVAKLVRPAKAGHAGTLDPLATGVLVVCVGPATRLTDVVHRQTKEYRARFLLGKTSNTDDVEGEVVDVVDAPAVTREDVEAVLPRFLGRIEQVPPQFSAVHVGGRRAYQLARAGQEVAIEPREVEVTRLDLVEFSPAEIVVDIECSSGTYVRSIGRDMGDELGCGAVMSELVRTRVGTLRLQDAVEFDALNSESLRDQLLPATSVLGDLPSFRCTDNDLTEICCGRLIKLPAETRFADSSTVAVIGPDGELACLSEYQSADGTLAPKQVFAKVSQ